MRIQELTEYLDTYLRAGEFHDYAPNGLQVEGTREVKHIVLGVSASLGLIDEAARRGADVVLVHHGWFWKGESPRIAGVKGCRIRHLMQSGMHLVGYHLPLDAHETVGNNAELARVLGLTIESRHGEYGLLHVGEIISGAMLAADFARWFIQANSMMMRFVGYRANEYFPVGPSANRFFLAIVCLTCRSG